MNVSQTAHKECVILEAFLITTPTRRDAFAMVKEDFAVILKAGCCPCRGG